MTSSASSPTGVALFRVGLRLGRTLVAVLLCWGIAACAALVLSNLLDSFALAGWFDAFAAAATVAVLNAVLWPVVTRLVPAVAVLTFGLGGFLVNGWIELLVLDAIPGVRLTGIGAAVLVTAVLSAVSGLAGAVFALDEDELFQRRVIRRALRRGQPRGADGRSGVPGVVFVQIDGLGYDVLRRAMRDGNAPTLARWIATGSHRLLDWHTDWSSQTGASQCAILLGSNFDVPAFRWYEKESGTLLVCNRPRWAAEIERRHSTGHGLLSGGGASRGNLFSGDAPDAILTVSQAGRRKGRIGAGYQAYFASPYNFFRTLGAALAELVRELLAAADARRRGVWPRVPRGGWYPLLRVLSTVVSRDVIVEAVIHDMLAGVPVVYADLVGYDEVAHHSGVERHDALTVLREIDHQLARLARAADFAPRPYEFVVLSDHGQSQGPPFAMRFETSLDELVRSACGRGDGILPTQRRGAPAESWVAAAALAEAAGSGGPVGTAMRRSAQRQPTPEVDPEGVPLPVGEAARLAAEQHSAREGLLVLASGNLGLVYLTDEPERVSLERLSARYPRLVPRLLDHPGVGFLLVHSEQDGPVVLGRGGRRCLESGAVVGVDPLAGFGPHAARLLRRAAEFPHIADVMVNSSYDPQTDEVYAFERLVGSHGGLGGGQNLAFVLAPSGFVGPSEELVGAESVHQLFRGWLTLLGHLPEEPSGESPAVLGRVDVAPPPDG